MMTFEKDLFQKVERGEITAAEASSLLEQMHQQEASGDPVLGETQEQDVFRSPEVSEVESGDLRRFGRFTRWWIVPYTLGVLLTALGAFWMYLGWNGGQITFGFWVAWFPFLLGVMLMALSWRARASHWLHVRVHQAPGRRPERLTISLPLPLGLIKWANRSFGHHFPPEVRGIDLDDLIDSIETSVTSDNPIYVWVDDEKEQQQVEVWIGRGADGSD